MFKGLANKHISVVMSTAQWKKKMVVSILKNTRIGSVTKLKIMKHAKYMSQGEIE